MNSDTVNHKSCNIHFTDGCVLTISISCLLICFLYVASNGQVQSVHSELPLAYIQKLAIPATTNSVPMSPAPKISKGPAKKAGPLIKDTLDIVELQRRLIQAVDVKLRDDIYTKLHIDVNPQVNINSHIVSEGLLKTDLDRFGTTRGFERKMWCRISARIEYSDHESQALYAIGIAKATKRWIGKGFTLTDVQLVNSLASIVSSRLLASLRKGSSSILATESRFAIFPTFVPDVIEIVAGKMGGTSKSSVNAPSLARQADILFHPELGPLSIVVRESNNVSTGNHTQIGTVSKFKDMIDSIALQRECDRLNVDYLFVSNIESIDAEKELGDGPESLLIKTIRADATVEGILYSLKENKIVWRDIAEGGTVAHLETIRRQSRIRTDEQCILDAVRTAFAHLRSQFDDYLKVFDR